MNKEQWRELREKLGYTKAQFGRLMGFGVHARVTAHKKESGVLPLARPDTEIMLRDKQLMKTKVGLRFLYKLSKRFK